MKKIRCAIYDRVSTEIQVKEGLSLEAQKQALTDYALSHGYKIVGYYEDEGITARKKMQNRKDLQRLLRDVEADKIDLILVTKLDRWFRNIKDYHNTQSILEAHHCNWKTIYEEYDTSTSNGRFAINIMLSVNENECDRTSERIKTVFAYKKSLGEHINGRPAYGYISDDKKALIKDPETEEIVNEVFDYYFLTFSKHRTIEHILEKYADHPKCPTMYQVNRILKSDVYTGKKYGIDNYCPAYISPEQFRKIQSITDSKIISHQTEPFLFSSLIKCPVCGKKFNGFVTRRKLKSGRTTEYKRYRCGSKFTEYHNGACISESVVENYLLSHVEEKLRDGILNMSQKKKEQSKKPNETIKLKAEMDRLNSMYQKGRIKESYYDEQYAILEEKIRSCSTADNIDASLEAYRALLDSFGEGWKEIYAGLDIGHKKAFWKEIIKEIVLDKNSRKICDFYFNV